MNISKQTIGLIITIVILTSSLVMCISIFENGDDNSQELTDEVQIPENGDWKIKNGSNYLIENREIILNGNLLIENGSLTFKNVVLKMNCSSTVNTWKNWWKNEHVNYGLHRRNCSNEKGLRF